MGNQKINQPRAFKVALIYMVEERTKEQVADLYKQLQACGIEIFLFSKDMPTVESHEAEMHQQIKHADSVIICYSENFERGRGYRHQEIKIALKEQKMRPPGNAYLIPVRLDECRVPDYLNEPRVLDYFQREHFDGIMRWGLVVRRKQLLEEGQQIESFTYDLPQQADETKETIFPGDALFPTNRAGVSGVWNVPYARNLVFTGREHLLIQIAEALHGNNVAALSQPQAISGLGGIGKTQVAVEYAYQHCHEYEAVLWTRADNREALLSGYAEMARVLNLPQQDEQDQSLIVKAVLQWLKTRTRWLLILDNADELEIVREFLPTPLYGHVLLTTRARSMGRLARQVEVETMDTETGALLLLRRAGLVVSDASLEAASSSDVALARAMAQEMGGLPLALDQAGAYIEEIPCSLSEYQALYHTHQTRLLKERRGVVSDHPESVTTTWSLSFQKVEQQDAAAADLLRFLAFLAPDAIPEEIIFAGVAHLGPPAQQLGEDLLAFHTALEVLGKYSLIRRELSTNTLSVHRLVQAVLQDTLEQEAQRTWIERVVLTVNAVFPRVEYATWPQCERLLSQALIAVEYIEHYQLVHEQAARLLVETATYLRDRARYGEAESLYQRALAIREQQLGSEHPLVAAPLNGLANLYREQGKYAEAESLYQRALAIFEQQLGSEHPQVAYPLNNLGDLYSDQGKYAEAEPLFQRALAIFGQQLGPDPPLMAYPLNNLALLYWRQGKYAEAEPLYRRALAIRERLLGPKHPLVAYPLDGLAELYREQGKYAEAEPLYLRALSIWEQNLGPKHPNVALPLNNLAELYYGQGKYAEAESLFQRALSIFEQQLGETHPHVAYPLNNLAELYREQGQYAEAEPLYQRAISILEQQLGETHPNVAHPLNGLANLYREQGQYAEAEPLLQRALHIREQQKGPVHPETAATLHDLATLREQQRHHQEALALYQRALAIREQVLGPDHPKNRATRERLTALRERIGREADAPSQENTLPEQRE